MSLPVIQYMGQLTGMKFDMFWKQCEQRIMSNLNQTLNAKNIALISNLYSSEKKGSLEFWNMINMKFVENLKNFTVRDFSSII